MQLFMKLVQLFCYYYEIRNVFDLCKCILATVYKNRNLCVFENVNYEIMIHFESYSSCCINLFLLSFQTT